MYGWITPGSSTECPSTSSFIISSEQRTTTGRYFQEERHLLFTHTSLQCWSQISVDTNKGKQLLDGLLCLAIPANFFCFLESNPITKISRNKINVTGCYTHSDPSFHQKAINAIASIPLLLPICHSSVQPVHYEAAPIEIFNTLKYINGRLPEADRNGILGWSFIIKDNSQKRNHLSKWKTKKPLRIGKCLPAELSKTLKSDPLCDSPASLCPSFSVSS